MMGLGMFTVKESPVLFYGVSALTQFFFSGFNTAIMPSSRIVWNMGVEDRTAQRWIPICLYITWQQDGHGSWHFASCHGPGNVCGYVAGDSRNPAVLAVIKHSFTTIPGLFWIITGIVLFFYRLNRRRYNEIMKEMYEGGT